MDTQQRKQEILQVTERFTDLCRILGEPEAVEPIEPLRRCYQVGRFELVVVGEIKKGKSRFINALLGEEDLLPVLHEVATSTVYHIQYGEQRKYTVFFLPRDPDDLARSTPEPLEISREQLAEFGTEDGNPKNQKGVDRIEVELPHPLLHSGLVITDTPGLGGLFKEHAVITWRYMPRANAFCFVVDSIEAMMGQGEKDALQRLYEMKEMKPRIFFVQTKIDQAGTANWQEWRKRNLDIIEGVLRQPRQQLQYFPVSSKLKEISDVDDDPVLRGDSGFVPLLNYLENTLILGMHNDLAWDLLNAMGEQALRLRQNLQNRLEILATQTREALDALERELKTAKAKYDQWKAGDYVQIVRDYHDRSRELRRKTRHSLQNQLDPAASGPVVSRVINEVRQGDYKAKWICDNAASLQSRSVDYGSRIIFEIQGDYNQEMQALVSETIRRLEQSCPSREIDPGALAEWQSRMISTDSGQGIGNVGSTYETARNVTLGGLFGLAVTSMVFPPAGIAVLMGGIAGAIWAGIDLSGRRREEAINKLQDSLRDIVRRLQREALQQFEENSEQFEKDTRRVFDNAVQAALRSLENRQTTLNQTRASTTEQNRAESQRLTQQLTQVDELMETLQQQWHSLSN